MSGVVSFAACGLIAALAVWLLAGLLLRVVGAFLAAGGLLWPPR